MAEDHGSSVMNDKQYEGLREEGDEREPRGRDRQLAGLFERCRYGVGLGFGFGGQERLEPGRCGAAEEGRGTQGRRRDRAEERSTAARPGLAWAGSGC